MTKRILLNCDRALFSRKSTECHTLIKPWAAQQLGSWCHRTLLMFPHEATIGYGNEPSGRRHLGKEIVREQYNCSTDISKSSRWAQFKVSLPSRQSINAQGCGSVAKWLCGETSRNNKQGFQPVLWDGAQT